MLKADVLLKCLCHMAKRIYGPKIKTALTLFPLCLGPRIPPSCVYKCLTVSTEVVTTLGGVTESNAVFELLP